MDLALYYTSKNLEAFDFTLFKFSLSVCFVLIHLELRAV